MYVYNDAVFTVEDWNGIQEIARSRKREDPLKVGRFGIGFNSVYHVTGEDCLEMLVIISIIKLPNSASLANKFLYVITMRYLKANNLFKRKLVLF